MLSPDTRSAPPAARITAAVANSLLLGTCPFFRASRSFFEVGSSVFSELIGDGAYQPGATRVAPLASGRSGSDRVGCSPIEVGCRGA